MKGSPGQVEEPGDQQAGPVFQRVANAVVDAPWHLGVRHLDIPITPQKVWKVLRDAGVSD